MHDHLEMWGQRFAGVCAGNVGIKLRWAIVLQTLYVAVDC